MEEDARNDSLLVGCLRLPSLLVFRHSRKIATPKGAGRGQDIGHMNPRLCDREDWGLRRECREFLQQAG